MAPKKTPPAPASEPATITAYKGFDANFRCRDFQYEVGQTYEHKGDVVACRSGYHACEHPLNVFAYYPPAISRYAEVTLAGAMAREEDGDTKIAAAKITINVEVSIGELIKRAWDFVWSRVKIEEGGHATGGQGAASATGTRGAAMSAGYEGRVMGANGNALFLIERDDRLNIVAVWAGIAGRDGVKADTWYMLSGGQPVEVA